MSRATKSFLTPLQQDRRERVFEATRRLLGKLGAEEITLRDIAKASQTSEAMLYNRFGSRAGLIDAAVLDTIQHSAQSLIKHQGASTPVQKFLNSSAVLCDAILESHGFSKALMSTHFKNGGDRTISRYMTDTIYNIWFPVLDEMVRGKLLRPWISIPLLCQDICDRHFSVAGKWAQGLYADRELHARSEFVILGALLGASQGKQEKEVEECLMKLTVRLGKMSKKSKL